jgi:hypothetical protein
VRNQTLMAMMHLGRQTKEKKHELKVTYFCYKCVARDYVHLQFVDVIRHFFRLGWYLMSEIL